MGQRSRKRGRREKPPAGEARREKAAPSAVATAPKPSAVARARSEERNAAVRATLVPFAPGERPWPIKIGSLLALLVGGGDLVDVILGGRLTFGRTHAGVGGVALFSVLMLICAWGMWQMRYWAVLAFQAVLAIVILIFSLLLIRASNLLGLAISLVIVAGGGYLFFKLVRVLSRLQMPRYSGR